MQIRINGVEEEIECDIYTGEKDSIGKKIYTGDILECLRLKDIAEKVKGNIQDEIINNNCDSILIETLHYTDYPIRYKLYLVKDGKIYRGINNEAKASCTSELDEVYKDLVEVSEIIGRGREILERYIEGTEAISEVPYKFVLSEHIIDPVPGARPRESSITIEKSGCKTVAELKNEANKIQVKAALIGASTKITRLDEIEGILVIESFIRLKDRDRVELRVLTVGKPKMHYATLCKVSKYQEIYIEGSIINLDNQEIVPIVEYVKRKRVILRNSLVYNKESIERAFINQLGTCEKVEITGNKFKDIKEITGTFHGVNIDEIIIEDNDFLDLEVTGKEIGSTEAKLTIRNNRVGGRVNGSQSK